MTEMSVSHDERASARGYVAPRRDDNVAVFRGATRHSRHVRILRIAIPIGIALCLLVIVIATFFNPLRFLYKLPKDMGTLVISGTKITMQQPRLSGFTRDARGYDVSASAAAQDLTKPNMVELKDIRARLDMQDKSEVQLSAATGFYDTKAEILTLGQNIILSSSTGYEGRLSEAIVDIRKGYIVSEKPVEVKLLKGMLNANRLEVIDSGDLLRFGGGVAMTLTLTPADVEPAKAGTQ
jgi:lipopolysaccharide export system protein LptC